MNYKALNKLIENFDSLRIKANLLERKTVKEIDSEEGEQGESSEYQEIYKTPLENVFIKLKIGTDSYGSNEFVAGLQFVSPIEKQVISYEPIN